MSSPNFDAHALQEAFINLHQQGLSFEQMRDIFRSTVWFCDALARVEREGPERLLMLLPSP
jgi:hypothetical protein